MVKALVVLLAIRQLETRLTSSTITGAMWLFRWCVRHQKWKTQDEYRQDTSESTENLRKLIKGISQKLAAYDERNKSGHVTVSFPSDDFPFDAKSLGQPLPGNKIVDIYRFNEKLRRGDDEDNTFVATHEEITELTELALELLNFADFHSEDETGAENAKLTWLKKILAQHPESKFLVFTESLQTCEIIIKALPTESEKLTGDMSLAEREAAVSKLRDVNSPVRVLVATSAADEGFDFQVANHVIHWDLSPNPPDLLHAQYLLFATHPLREIENHLSASTDSYLTFYAFSSDFSQPIYLPGASAKKVYHLISLLEENALKASSTSVKTNVLEAAKNVSKELTNWLNQSRKLGGLTKKSYFLPIPVALVAVI